MLPRFFPRPHNLQLLSGSPNFALQLFDSLPFPQTFGMASSDDLVYYLIERLSRKEMS